MMAQGPTAPLLTLLTCRPTFASPWGSRAHVTLLSVPRLALPAGRADGARARGRRAASGACYGTSCARPMASHCSSRRSPSSSWPHSGYRARPAGSVRQCGTGDRDSRDAAGFLDGSARSARAGERHGAARGHHWPRIPLCAPPGRDAAGRGRLCARICNSWWRRSCSTSVVWAPRRCISSSTP